MPRKRTGHPGRCTRAPGGRRWPEGAWALLVMIRYVTRRMSLCVTCHYILLFKKGLERWALTKVYSFYSANTFGSVSVWVNISHGTWASSPAAWCFYGTLWPLTLVTPVSPLQTFSSGPPHVRWLRGAKGYSQGPRDRRTAKFDVKRWCWRVGPERRLLSGGLTDFQPRWGQDWAQFSCRWDEEETFSRTVSFSNFLVQTLNWMNALVWSVY